MAETDDKPNDFTESLVATPAHLKDLLSSFQRRIQSFRLNNKAVNERDLVILNDVEDYIKLKFLEIPSCSSTIHDTLATQNTDNAAENISDPDSLESCANEIDEMHRILNDEIERERQNDVDDGRVNESEIANHCNIAAQPSRRHTPESLKAHTIAPHVPYKLKNGILHFFPSHEQWSDFKEFLRVVKSSEAVESGVCKITVPCAGAFHGKGTSFPPGHAYRTQIRENGTVAIDLMPSSVTPSSLIMGGISDWTAQEAVDMFEKQIKQRSGLKDTRYCSDINAKLPNERSRLGLPLISPIWPLTGDNLTRTRARIPGLHFPYAYKANASFGAVFAAHKEDYDLFSVNHLYQHRKIWIIIPRSAAALLESTFRESIPAVKLSHCAQFIRHYASYLPLEVLDRWKVPYKIVQQNAGETVLVFPGTYHQGFSIGETVAEAVNYADDDWDPTLYEACGPDTCPFNFIDQDLMAIRNLDEDQKSADEKEVDDEPEPSEREAAEDDLACDGKSKPMDRQSRRHVRRVAKRKATKELFVSNKKNRNDLRSDNSKNIIALKKAGRKEVSAVLEEVTSRPTIDGITIYHNVIDLLDEDNAEYDDTRVLTLVRLFYAIASPDAICQLRDACQLIRQGSFEITESTNNILGTIKALDRLDANSHTVSIAKRFYLVALSTKRFELQTSLAESSVTRATQGTNDEVFGRSDTLALTHLMTEAYPQLKPTRACKTQGKDEYGIKRKLLKERLLSGQKWSKLSEVFAPGILALVPTQGEYHVSNKDFERLSLNAINALITLLENHRGNFLRTVSQSISTLVSKLPQGNLSLDKIYFEGTDASRIKREKYDSQGLLELCKVDSSQPDAAIN